MLPKINGKSFLTSSEEDLKLLIDNPDYRENEYIDYKRTFSFLEMEKGRERTAKINEFKSDVCSFANSSGGYLIYGISDDSGCASELVGIEINDDNTDKFELDRRNNLINIYPKTPHVEFHFVKLENEKYVVIIYIKRDGFAPYTYIEDENNYRFFKRAGNKKQTITYSELKNMFNQSLSLEKEIQSYRTERVNYYLSQEDDSQNSFSQFFLLHIIPETFLDLSYNENMYVLEKKGGLDFSNIFQAFSCSSWSIPCVDGLRFVSNSEFVPQAECIIYNNKTVECFFPLKKLVEDGNPRYPTGFLPCNYLFEKIKDMLYAYFEKFAPVLNSEKVYICISIIGCKGIATTSEREEFFSFYKGNFDRNRVICSPVLVEKLNLEEQELAIKKLHVEFMLAVGRKHDQKLNDIIKELYHEKEEGK